MKLGAMQPYLFPYLGYFQLMDAVDQYYFCGSVQYIKHGWINRNRIITNKKLGETSYFSFSVAKDDYTKRINERYYSNLKADKEKLMRNIYQTYKSARNFQEAYYIIEQAMDCENENVAYFNMNANYIIAKYLGVAEKIHAIDSVTDKNFWEKFYKHNYEERMIYICKYFNCDTYVNAIGGMELYHKETFEKNGVNLGFIQMLNDVEYMQWENDFISNLSIIDVIMHNDREETRKLLKKYTINY